MAILKFASRPGCCTIEIVKWQCRIINLYCTIKFGSTIFSELYKIGIAIIICHWPQQLVSNRDQAYLYIPVLWPFCCIFFCSFFFYIASIQSVESVFFPLLRIYRLLNWSLNHQYRWWLSRLQFSFTNKWTVWIKRHPASAVCPFLTLLLPLSLVSLTVIFTYAIRSVYVIHFYIHSYI